MLDVIRAKQEDALYISRCARIAYADECRSRNVENLSPLYPSVNDVIRDIENHIYYKIIFDKRIIGGLYLVKKESDTLVIEDFCIEPNYQNKGYGYKILLHLESVNQNIKQWRLVTPTYSIGNQALYNKLGYNKLETIKEDDLDVIKYQKYICKISERINLEFARIHEKELIYKMLISPDVYSFMFDDKHPAPTLEEFSEEPDFLYCGKPNIEGNYLIIKYQGIVVGSISYSLNEGTIKSYEIDIWIANQEHLGKGIGTESITMLIDYIIEKYGVYTFIIRPWRKNIKAINTYKKCGFVEMDKVNLIKYYSDVDYEEYGNGDYGEETVNLVMNRK
jgi:RimJ/RimL family protein N-acetyltransferase